MKKANKTWYALRTLFRSVATGKPKHVDRDFDPDSTLIKNRVVLVRATGFSDAIKQGEREAARYCKSVKFTNVYGQAVRSKYLGAVDAFSFDGKPGPLVEVYSGTFLAPRSVRDSSMIAQTFGPSRDVNPRERDKFVDGEILREVEKVMRRPKQETAVASQTKKRRSRAR